MHGIHGILLQVSPNFHGWTPSSERTATSLRPLCGSSLSQHAQEDVQPRLDVVALESRESDSVVALHREFPSRDRPCTQDMIENSLQQDDDGVEFHDPFLQNVLVSLSGGEVWVDIVQICKRGSIGIGHDAKLE